MLCPDANNSWKSLLCVLPQEAPLAMVVPPEMGGFPAGTRGAPSALLAPSSHCWGVGEGCAMAQCPPGRCHWCLSWGAGERGCRCGYPMSRSGRFVGTCMAKRQQHPHSPRWAGIQPPPSGCTAQRVRGAASLRQGGCFHSWQSLTCSSSYPLWFLKFTDLLLVSKWAIATPFLTPYPGRR